ncbi:MAG: right-handed parallel beta-helix repeat-containing protein [Thaumarchaeota archaeon]|nr:right-handed parallel beta-helix repeat-containing protein [Nitrososphaerota archaeon]
MNTRNSRIMGVRHVVLISILMMSAFAIFSPTVFASADPSCGSFITSSTTLTGDIGPCSVVGLYVSGNDITLDCAGHTLSGTGADGSAGIVASGPSGVTIKNCNVTGFFQGIYMDFSSNNILSGNTVNGNTFGIFMQRTSGSAITDNTADGNSQDGVFMGFGTSGNTLTGNTANNNAFYGFEDSTTGSGTSGTGNTYSSDVCNSNAVGNSRPGGLCGSPTFSATFDQNGIPSSGTTWGVTVGLSHYTGTGTSITVSGLSGTLSYIYDSTVAGSAGTHYTCNTGCTGSVSGSATESASYATQYLLTVATSPSGLTPSPTASPASSSGYYDAGTSVTLTANTVPGYIFIDWKIDGTDQSLFTNMVSVTMNGPHDGTAVYQTPQQALQSLITLKESMGLPQGLTTSLDAKLNAASDSLNSGDDNTAKNQLNAFIHEVNAQAGKKITQDQANQLMSGAQNIINSIS